MDLNALKNTAPWEWPDDADRTLLEVLRDPRATATDRLLAAELAGEFAVINDQLSEALLSILRDGDEADDMRGRAALSLGTALDQGFCSEFDDEDEIIISETEYLTIGMWLRRLYYQADISDDVRRQILEASVRSPEDWHRAAVRAAYAANDREWRLTAVYCMRFVKGFDERILEALVSEDEDFRYNALLAAGNWGMEDAWPHILSLLKNKDTDKDMLLAAIEAVAGISPYQAPEVLYEFTNSTDDDIVDAAFEALAMAEAIAEEEGLNDDDDCEDESDDDLFF